MAPEGPGALRSFSTFLGFAALLRFWLFTSSGSFSVGTVWFTFSAALSVSSCYTRPAVLVIKERITALMPPLVLSNHGGPVMKISHPVLCFVFKAI